MPDNNDQSDQETIAPRQARASASNTKRLGGITLLLAISGLVAIGLAVNQEATSIPGRDVDLCPASVDASATYLVDLRKPIDPDALPAQLLRSVTQSLQNNAELLVYALSGDSDAPRQRVGRVCKPYDNADIQALAKDDDELRDCDNIPAQVSASTRLAARLFCERREALATSVAALGAKPVAPLASAHLIEALDGTALEFESRPGPHKLYVFSDMLHHAAWYSHFDIDWEWWPSANLASLRTRSAPAVDPADFSNADVVIFHVARRDLTEQPRAARALRQFWQGYFGDAAVDFVDQPVMDGYDAMSLMDLDSETDQTQFMLEQERAALAQERERLRQQANELAQLEARLMRQELRLVREARRIGADTAEYAPPSEDVPLEGEADGDQPEADARQDGEAAIEPVGEGGDS